MNTIIRKITQSGIGMALALCVAGIAQAQTPVLVYDNTASPRNLGVSTPTGATAFGDQITISPAVGTSNIQLTQFAFEADAVGGGSATINFYADSAGSPGASFWTSDPITMVAGVNSYTIQNLNNAVAPTTSFFWAATFSNTADQLTLFNGPTVGSSTDSFWSFDGSTWTSLDITGPNAGPANFGAQVMAVPEPTTIVFGILGGLALIGVRRFRRS